LLQCLYDQHTSTQVRSSHGFPFQFKMRLLTRWWPSRQHLYRVHAPPENYCSSCYEVFNNRSQLDSHIRRRPPCEIATPMFTEKITHQQSIQLKKKQYGKTTAENWYSIFRILFPKAQLPESPCRFPFTQDTRPMLR
jgi:hypothetical protein